MSSSFHEGRGNYSSMGYPREDNYVAHLGQRVDPHTYTRVNGVLPAMRRTLIRLHRGRIHSVISQRNEGLAILLAASPLSGSCWNLARFTAAFPLVRPCKGFSRCGVNLCGAEGCQGGDERVWA